MSAIELAIASKSARSMTPFRSVSNWSRALSMFVFCKLLSMDFKLASGESHV
nr:hypothetical protein [Kibdelosporangium sp. MJ126-NF4]CTQ99151.1 hypothetical protein [Kibdelosporangium sp. MJ126-NF4]